MLTVSITKDNLTHIFKTFPFGILSVKVIIETLHIINVPLHLLLEVELFANESNKILCSILDIELVTVLVMVPVDTLLFTGSIPIFLRSILGQVTPAVYLTLGLGCHSTETN